jgi:hypothetical protein
MARHHQRPQLGIGAVRWLLLGPETAGDGPRGKTMLEWYEQRATWMTVAWVVFAHLLALTLYACTDGPVKEGPQYGGTVAAAGDGTPAQGAADPWDEPAAAGEDPWGDTASGGDESGDDKAAQLPSDPPAGAGEPMGQGEERADQMDEDELEEGSDDADEEWGEDEFEEEDLDGAELEDGEDDDEEDDEQEDDEQEDEDEVDEDDEEEG